MVGAKLIISGIQKVGIKDSEMNQKVVMALKKVMWMLIQMISSKMDYWIMSKNSTKCLGMNQSIVKILVSIRIHLLIVNKQEINKIEW